MVLFRRPCPILDARIGFPLRSVLSAVCAMALLVGCGEPREESPDVIILQTGRIRGNVYPTDLQSIAPLQHYPYVAGYVKQVREEAARSGARVVLVDLGDSLGGSFASHATDYGNMIAFFNALDYDAVMLGNLDNNVMPEALSELSAKVLNPFANPSGAPATADTTFGVRLESEKGVPVELLANFYGDTSRDQYPDRFPTWFGDTPSGVVPVRDYTAVVDSLGERPDGTLTSLLWMKFESPKNPPEEFLGALVGLDVDIILAHRIYSGRERDVWAQETFYDWTPPISENILRNNGGFTVARVDLKRNAEGGWEVLNQELVPMTANTAARDETVVNEISAFSAQIDEADKFIADLDEPVDEESILVSFLSALSRIDGTEIAAYSRNSVRTAWGAGRLTASKVFNALPWTTPLVQMDVTPEQLVRLGEIGGVVFLRRDGLDPGATVTLTTSRFFASVLAERLGLPADSMRDAGEASEFDYFVDYLTDSPKPLTFHIPEGWEFVTPRS